MVEIELALIATDVIPSIVSKSNAETVESEIVILYALLLLISVRVLRVATSVSVTVAVIVPDFCESYPFYEAYVNVKERFEGELVGREGR